MPGTSEQITRLREEGMAAIAAARSESDLLDAKGRFFGKKGAVSGILKGVAALPVEERKAIGELANRARAELESAFDARLAGIREQERFLREGRERIDVTLPGRGPMPGHRHPVSQTMSDILSVFRRLGFSIRGGPDVETDYYNFEAL
ncbi:MAG TPA: phenylalanine--tRNA ligase subunit alpha, partial [Candidatus Deferrimicrobium sp.]|nr:phenylalanine--tRNA ligase subunit alpha [Candidatus Deferrimicrobium sp.]